MSLAKWKLVWKSDSKVSDNSASFLLPTSDFQFSINFSNAYCVLLYLTLIIQLFSILQDFTSFLKSESCSLSPWIATNLLQPKFLNFLLDKRLTCPWEKYFHVLFVGPTNTQKAKDEAPESLRALFGTGKMLWERLRDGRFKINSQEVMVLGR